MRKSQTTTTNVFLLLRFDIEKFMFYSETYFEKLSLYCYIYITVFFAWQVIGNAVINTNAHIDMHWFCRSRTLNQNTRQ